VGRGGEGSEKPKFLKESLKLINLNFWGVERLHTEKPSIREVWIFSVPAHYTHTVVDFLFVN